MKPRKLKRLWERYKRTLQEREEKKAALNAAVKKGKGKKLSSEEERLLEKYRLKQYTGVPAEGIKSRLGINPATWSYPGRHADVAAEIKKIAKRRKKVVINDVGYGELTAPEKGGKSWAPQFQDIRKALEETGVEYQYNGYVYEPERARITQESVPEKERRKHRFAGMDIVTATPAQQADVSLFLHVSEYLHPPETKAAFINILSSTKKGGYIITDIPGKQLPEELSEYYEVVKRIGREKYVLRKKKEINWDKIAGEGRS